MGGTNNDALVEFVVIGFIIGLICAFICASIAKGKGLEPTGYFLLGLFLGIIGLIVAAVAQPHVAPQGPPQPPGWYRDPWNQAWYRQWDGYQWTWQTSNGETTP